MPSTFSILSRILYMMSLIFYISVCFDILSSDPVNSYTSLLLLVFLFCSETELALIAAAILPRLCLRINAKISLSP